MADANSTPAKTCTKCGEAKAHTDFEWKDGAHLARRPDCKACRKKAYADYRIKNKAKIAAKNAAWQAANADAQKKYHAQYYEQNKERISESRSDWRKANADLVRQRHAEYRRNNPEKVRAMAAKWGDANKDKRQASEAKWRAANPEKRKLIRRLQSSNRRAKAQGEKLSPGLAARLYALQRGRCACCGEPLGTDYHMDHIMPIALGGPNTDSNIQLLRAACNHQKHAKHPVDFMRERGKLL